MGHPHSSISLNKTLVAYFLKYATRISDGLLILHFLCLPKENEAKEKASRVMPIFRKNIRIAYNISVSQLFLYNRTCLKASNGPRYSWTSAR